MVDVTNAFKATIKAVKSRLKSQGNAASGELATSIFPAAKQRGDFEKKARNVVSFVCFLLSVFSM